MQALETAVLLMEQGGETEESIMKYVHLIHLGLIRDGRLTEEYLQLAAQAQEAGQRNVAFGTGLFGSGSQLLNQYQAGQVGALNPFSTYLGAGSTIESLGQQPLDIGAQLGGRAATAGANVGQSLLQGGLSAARTQQAGQGGSPLGGLLQGASKDPRLQTGFERMFSGGQPVQTGYTGSPYMQPYENDLLAQQGQYYRQPSEFSYDGQQI
jgi:hypothetical protein